MDPIAEALNPFEEYGEIAKPRFLQKKEDRAAAVKRRLEEERAEQREKAFLLNGYRAWRRSLKQALLDGRHRGSMHRLFSFLRGMGPDDAELLIGLVRTDPVLQGDAGLLLPDEQETVMLEIGQAVIRVRLGLGLLPMDDSLSCFNHAPGFPRVEPSALDIIRGIVMGRE